MILKFHRPSGGLESYVALMVYHRGYSPPHRVEQFLPDGSVDLVIDLSEDEKYVFDNDTLRPVQSCRRSWVSGIRSGYISISAGSGSEMLVVSFRAAGAGPFLHTPLYELTDKVVDADVLFGSGISRLRDKMRSLPTPREKFLAVERFLWRRFRRPVNGHRLASFASHAIDRSPQTTTIDSVASGAGISCKHLISVFREYVGTTPKKYQRIRRFQAVVAAVEYEHVVDWAQVALECGFYDQSHLIREFRRFSGMTPAQYVEAKGDVLNYVPVA